MKSLAEQKDGVCSVILSQLYMKCVLNDYVALIKWAVEAREILARLDSDHPDSGTATELLKELLE